MEKEIKQTMDYKGAQIKKAMDVKNEAIFISGSARDATLMTTTFYESYRGLSQKRKDIEDMESFLREKWQMWQKFFYDQMTGQMPIEPECSMCGAKMKISSKGNWYCPEAYNKFNLKHNPGTQLSSNEQNFLDNLPK